MPFVDDILRRGSVSIVGLAKNAGKTEVLNHVLRRVGAMSGRDGVRVAARVAVTSIGLDGEATDQVTRTPKPEIELPEGTVFVTSETHYRQKRLVAEVLDVGGRATALGRSVTARALSTGKVVLSGPPDTESLTEMIGSLEQFGVRTVVVDGALSRMSHASPAVTEGMILVTGAAVSLDVAEIVRQTKFTFDLTRLPVVEEPVFDGAVWIPGMLGEGMLERLRMQPDAESTHVVVHDFTRIFASPPTFYSFLARGGRIGVLQRSEVLAVCVNPASPTGYSLDSDMLIARLGEALGVPVYDVFRI
jgi:hypothetical protein